MELSGGETCTVDQELIEDEFEDISCSADPEFDAAWKAFSICEYQESQIAEDQDELAAFNQKLIQEAYENGWINEPEEGTAEEIEIDGQELMCIAVNQGSYKYRVEGGSDDDASKYKAMCESSVDLTCSVKCAMQGSGAKEQSGVTQGQAEEAAEEAAAEIDQDEAEDAAMQLGAAFTESMNNAWDTQGWSLKDCGDVDEEPDCGC